MKNTIKEISDLRREYLKQKLAETEAKSYLPQLIRIGESLSWSDSDWNRYESLVKIELGKLNYLEKELGDEKFNQFLETNSFGLESDNAKITPERRKEKLSNKMYYNSFVNEIKQILEKREF